MTIMMPIMISAMRVQSILRFLLLVFWPWPRGAPGASVVTCPYLLTPRRRALVRPRAPVQRRSIAQTDFGGSSHRAGIILPYGYNNLYHEQFSFQFRLAGRLRWGVAVGLGLIGLAIVSLLRSFTPGSQASTDGRGRRLNRALAYSLGLGCGGAGRGWPAGAATLPPVPDDEFAVGRGRGAGRRGAGPDPFRLLAQPTPTGRGDPGH